MNADGLSTDGPIDRSYLSSITEDDEEFERELIDSYLGASPPTLDRLRDAVSRSDVGEVREAAHALKGSSRAIGAVALGTLCETLEARARAEDLSEAEALRVAIVQGYQEITTYIAETWALPA